MLPCDKLLKFLEIRVIIGKFPKCVEKGFKIFYLSSMI